MRSYVFRTPGALLTKQCEVSPPAHQCRAGSSHSGWGSSGTLLVPLPRRSGPSLCHLLPPHLNTCRLAEARPVGRPRTTWLRMIHDNLHCLNFRVHTALEETSGKQEIGTFGIKSLKSSVRQHSTAEFATEEECDFTMVSEEKLGDTFAIVLPFHKKTVNVVVTAYMRM